MNLENLKITEWRGYERHDFTYNGHTGLIVLPHAPADDHPWVWRAEFFSCFDTVDMDLLSKGWAVAYYAISDMYGCPSSIKLMKEFRDMLVPEYHLKPTAALFGFSRGGLYTVGYTAAHPADIAAIYLDAPVCDITSWPGGFGEGAGDPECWAGCKKIYNLTDESAKAFHENPLDQIKTLVENKIPCILVAGLADRTVPYSENGERFAAEYLRLGGEIKTILKPNCDHHPHSLEDPAEISAFLLVHK